MRCVIWLQTRPGRIQAAWRSGLVSELAPEEQAAANLLQSVLSADRIDPRDVGDAPPGTHDFDVLKGTRRIAVEDAGDR